MAKFKPRFWKPSDQTSPDQTTAEERRESSEGSGDAVVFNRNRNLSMEQQRQRLQVFRYRNHILYLLEKYQTLVLVGETGCGKSTQLPQYLLEAGWACGGRMVAVTQPRRVAVLTVARRVADERDVALGDEVGYAIRFDDCWDAATTRIKFVTDGLLIREMMHDPLLTAYSVVVLDEAHERTLYTDIVIGLLKKVTRKRPDLRVIVTSATLDAELFRDFFNNNDDTRDASKDTACVLSVEGRMFAVDTYYAVDPVPNYVTAAVETVVGLHRRENEGDVLVFLTGQEEVEQVVSLLIDEARRLPRDALKMRVLPIYGSLPTSEQLKVFDRTPRGVRKIVVATNIAEASVTISGIVYVVDCGFVKLRAYNPSCGLESLVVLPTSRASAEQRAGRAGRVRSGQVYRLYREEDFEKLPATTVPEMQRSDMSGVILQLKALGIDNILRFPFLSPPPAQNFVRGVELLYALGAIDDDCRLTTPLGAQMAELPMHPCCAKMLLASAELGCSDEALTIAAMMQIQNVFDTPSRQKSAGARAKRRFSAAEGDHISLLNVYRAFERHGRSRRWCCDHLVNYRGLCRAGEIRQQLVRLLKRAGLGVESCDGDVEIVQRCVVAGYFANAARLHYSGVYRTLRDDHDLHLHPTSVLATETPPPTWVVFSEVVQTTKDYMRDVTVVKSEWLYSIAPHYYQYGTDRELDNKRPRFR